MLEVGITFMAGICVGSLLVIWLDERCKSRA